MSFNLLPSILYMLSSLISNNIFFAVFFFGFEVFLFRVGSENERRIPSYENSFTVVGKNISSTFSLAFLSRKWAWYKIYGCLCIVIKHIAHNASIVHGIKECLVLAFIESLLEGRERIFMAYCPFQTVKGDYTRNVIVGWWERNIHLITSWNALEFVLAT